MRELDYKSHRKCSTEGCFKYAVKEGMCTRCYNKAHGIEKHIGRKPKASGHAKVKASLEELNKDNPERKERKTKGNGSTDDVMLKLINVKSEYQQKLTEIDNAIEVLKKYV